MLIPSVDGSVPTERRAVIAGVLIALLALAAVVLFEVLGTVFFAITVAYVLVPLKRRVAARGLSSWWASAATTAIATVGAAVLILGSAFLVYRRRAPVFDFLASLPRQFLIDAFGVSYVVNLSDVFAVVQGYLSAVLLTAVQALPVLIFKLTLFAFLVFALLVRHHDAEHALLAPVPSRYHDIVAAFAGRARGTLYAIYVLQAATAVGTFVLAVPTFTLLGYQYPWTLAFAAALLQFLPIVGPTIIVAGLAAFHLAFGDVTQAILTFVIAEFTVAWLPDVLVRPRLSQETANLSGSLYFVGFTGGLLTIGPVGIIAGPLVVALVVEAMDLLAADRGSQQRQLS